MAHNGVLTNDKELRKKFSLPETKIETDSYIALQLIESQGRLNFESIKYMAEQTEGSFSYSILDDKNNVWLVKGDSPLSILHFQKLKLYVYASTDEILYKALVDYQKTFSNLKMGEYEVIDIAAGDILKIRSDGVLERKSFEYKSFYVTDWWNYGLYNNDLEYTRENYIEDLKSVAVYQGYSPDDVNELLNAGFSPEEIEDYIYSEFGGEI